MSYVELSKLSFEDKLAKLDILIRQFELLEKQYPKAEFGKHVRELQTKRAEITSTIGKTVQRNRKTGEITLVDSIFNNWKRGTYLGLEDRPIDWSK